MDSLEKNEDIVHKNYTILRSYPDSKITQYIDWNINEYFDVVLQMCNGTINDDESVAIAVLNDKTLAIEYKQSYISALKTIIVSIKEITDSSLWPSLLDAGIIKYTEQNILDCYEVLKLNDSVISFINEGDMGVDFSKDIYDNAAKEALFDGIVICDSIENSKYEQILVSLEFCYNQFNIVSISDAKMGILINTGIIKMNADNLRFLRQNYPDQRFCFIKKNIDEYVNIMSDDLFLQEELLEVLDWGINDELKIKLLEFSESALTVIGKNYSTLVNLHILDNNLKSSDLMVLFSTFERWENTVQGKIFDYAVENIENIIDDPDAASEELIGKLFHAEKLGKNAKINLLIAIMPTLSVDRIKEILTILKLDNYIKIFTPRTKPRFEINDENEKLLAAFKRNGLIHDYVESSENEGYYSITKAKPSKSLPPVLL